MGPLGQEAGGRGQGAGGRGQAAAAVAASHSRGQEVLLGNKPRTERR
jgi:hypothetical protein